MASNTPLCSHRGLNGSLIHIRSLSPSQNTEYDRKRTWYEIENLASQQTMFSPWMEVKAADLCFRSSRLHLDPRRDLKDFISRKFGAIMGTLVAAPAYRNGPTFDFQYTLAMSNSQPSLVVMNNVHPAQPILRDTVGLFFKCTNNLKVLIHHSALFARICLQNSVIHGDFYMRNAQCVFTTQGPVKMTFIDFERAEMDVEPDRLGKYWFSAMCGFLIEFIHNACKKGLLSQRGQEKRDVLQLVFALNDILSGHIGQDRLFRFTDNYDEVLVNHQLWEKWIVDERDQEVLNKFGLQGLFKKQGGSNFRIQPGVLEQSSITKDSMLQMIYYMLNL